MCAQILSCFEVKVPMVWLGTQGCPAQKGGRLESLIRSIDAKVEQAIGAGVVLGILLCRLSGRSYMRPNI
jgi:hypothetical protein